LLRRGSAASGKSVRVEAVLRLFTPDDDYITASGGSPKSLPYFGGDDIGALRHKAIYIPEAASIADKRGVESDFTTMLRILISEGRIEYATVVTRENDTPITQVMRKDGPIATVITSARDNIELNYSLAYSFPRRTKAASKRRPSSVT
jgi:Zn-dependent M16 (insulinase) family peptidase